MEKQKEIDEKKEEENPVVITQTPNAIELLTGTVDQTLSEKRELKNKYQENEEFEQNYWQYHDKKSGSIQSNLATIKTGTTHETVQKEPSKPAEFMSNQEFLANNFETKDCNSNTKKTQWQRGNNNLVSELLDET